ncbi:hypothetical protein [Xanthomonas phaseoli]|uniref:hypothetical protein n=1 Tax=Xanthomonas phaseoli TaxID=1985254 RepID=UPI000311B057|nr:hypothetical protein [Xanthomonas phaseoli]
MKERVTATASALGACLTTTKASGGIHRIFGIVSGVAAIIDGRPQTAEAGVLGGLEDRGAEGQGHG